MRYIICEDSGSGQYFLSLIKDMILQLEYKMITSDMINKDISLTGTTIGVSKIYEYLKIISKREESKNNEYIIFIDNVSDNWDISAIVTKLYNLVSNNPNMHIFEYICIEELIVAPGNFELFIPVLKDDKSYQVIRNNYIKNGLGNSISLKRELDKAQIQYKTTETVFNKLLERVCINRKQKVGIREYNIMKHHYIYKGKWSECWKMDCTSNCPNDKCWEATSKNSEICSNCVSIWKEKSISCVFVNQNCKRKFAEEIECSKQLPIKLVDRIKLLFDIPQVRAIDNLK